MKNSLGGVMRALELDPEAESMCYYHAWIQILPVQLSHIGEAPRHTRKNELCYFSVPQIHGVATTGQAVPSFSCINLMQGCQSAFSSSWRGATAMCSRPLQLQRPGRVQSSTPQTGCHELEELSKCTECES
eukprot:1614773-Amphidinium_carterae.1